MNPTPAPVRGPGHQVARHGRPRVVLMGAVLEMCVLESARDAVDAGFDTVVLRPASIPLEGDEAESALAGLVRHGVSVAG